MKYLEPSIWQRRAIDGLATRLSAKGSGRAALLQLPTGFGKSLVAVRMYAQLRKRRPGLRLLIVLPKKGCPAGWKMAIGYEGNDHIEHNKWLKLPKFGGSLRFTTRLELVRAMLAPNVGRPPRLASELHQRPHLIVVDEVHKHRRLFETLSSIFQKTTVQDHSDTEYQLTKPFRSAPRGAKRWPKWVLLSATPFNPVSLDTIDPRDEGRSVDTSERDYLEDEEVLADELKRTLGAIAWLSGLRKEEWFEDYIRTARERLSNCDYHRPLHMPRELAVWPLNVKQRAFRPPSKSRWSMPNPKVDPFLVENSIRELVMTAKALEHLPGAGIRRAMAERIVLSGGLMTVKGRRIQGKVYSLSLGRSVNAAVKMLQKTGTTRPAKLESLVRFICDEVKGEHVLIFCVHRAVAVSVSKILQEALAHTKPYDAVRTAIGPIEEKDQRWFNRKTSGKTRVLVATDACSESIDLHQSANLLIHYELPWSPLRALQRVGRLWRIRRNEIRIGKRLATPRLPGIVHFAHPGSLDEEILSRLQRRWSHLAVLGLDYLKYNEALGVRLPAVKWQV